MNNYEIANAVGCFPMRMAREDRNEWRESEGTEKTIEKKKVNEKL